MVYYIGVLSIVVFCNLYVVDDVVLGMFDYCVVVDVLLLLCELIVEFGCIDFV